MPLKNRINCPHKWQGLKDHGCVYITGDGKCDNIEICPGNGDAWCVKMIGDGQLYQGENMRQKMNELILDTKVRNNKFISDLSALIWDGPSNKNAVKVDKNSFVVSSVEMGTNMTPFYHNFEDQYAFISRLMGVYELHRFGEIVDTIIQKGKFIYGGEVYIFHPEVVNHLKQVWELKDE